MKALLSFSVVVISIIFSTTHLAAQEPIHLAWLQADNVHCVATSVGLHGYDLRNNQHGLRWLLAPDLMFSFGAGVWIGGQVDLGGVRKKCVFRTVDPYYGRGFATPLTGLDTIREVDRIVAESELHDGDLSRYVGSREDLENRGYPLGLSIQSTVSVFESTSAFPNSILLTYVVTNSHPSRPIHGATVAFVFDPAVGPADNAMQAAAGDYIQQLSNSHVLVTKIRSQELGDGPFISAAVIPERGKTTTCRPLNIFAMPFEDGAAYDPITSGIIEDSQAPSDAVLAAAGDTTSLAPGESMTLHVLLTLSAENSLENDNYLLYLAEFASSILTSVENDDVTTGLRSVYPSPTNGADYVFVSSSGREELYRIHDVHGVVRTVTSDASGQLYIGNLATGVYWLTSASGTRGRFVVSR